MSVDDVYNLFGRLNPPNQLDRLMNKLDMPVQFRPQGPTLAGRQDEIITWGLRCRRAGLGKAGRSAARTD